MITPLHLYSLLSRERKGETDRQTSRQTKKESLTSTCESSTSTCKEVMGPKRQHRKNWISTETLKKIEERKRKKAEINNSRARAGKARAYVEYSHASKIANKSTNANKWEYVNMLVTETDEAAHQGNLQELCTTAKKLSGKFGKPERPTKD